MLAPGMAATGMEATQRLPATVTFSQTATAIMILGLPRASKSIAHKINFLLQFSRTPKPKVSVLCPVLHWVSQPWLVTAACLKLLACRI